MLPQYEFGKLHDLLQGGVVDGEWGVSAWLAQVLVDLGREALLGFLREDLGKESGPWPNCPR